MLKSLAAMNINNKSTGIFYNKISGIPNQSYHHHHHLPQSIYNDYLPNYGSPDKNYSNHYPNNCNQSLINFNPSHMYYQPGYRNLSVEYSDFSPNPFSREYLKSQNYSFNYHNTHHKPDSIITPTAMNLSINNIVLPSVCHKGGPDNSYNSSIPLPFNVNYSHSRHFSNNNLINTSANVLDNHPNIASSIDNVLSITQNQFTNQLFNKTNDEQIDIQSKKSSSINSKNIHLLKSY